MQRERLQGLLYQSKCELERNKFIEVMLVDYLECDYYQMLRR